MTEPVRVAIAGVGNCASSLVQGVEYYRDVTPDDGVPGLMHTVVGPYHVSDVEFVTAFLENVHGSVGTQKRRDGR